MTTIGRLGVLLAMLLLGAGCSHLPWSAEPAPAHDVPVGDAFRPEPGPVDEELEAVTDAPPPEPPLLPETDPNHLMTVLETRPDLAQLDEMYRQALVLLAHHQIEPARDLLFLLRGEAVATVPADRDSVAAAYLASLDRRVALLAGVLAEESVLNHAVARDDSLLAAAYAGVRGLSFPDSLVPVSGAARRSIESDLLSVRNAKVERWLDYFVDDGRRTLEIWLSRMSAVDSLIYAELDAAGLPHELIYLSAIESGFAPHARSSANAVGPWQFMAGTARHFHLRCDWWVDERRDFALSTRAATTYLTQLYHRFGDWGLVLAGYNTGEHRVERAIHLAGHNDVWRLRIPPQTVNHVAKFIAVATICEDPERYGLDVDVSPDLAFELVDVTDATDLSLIARCAGVDAETVKNLNPGLYRGATPPGRTDYSVKVPAGTGRRCLRQLRKVPLDERLTWRRHTIERGETLGAIAANYGTSVGEIAKLNKIRDVGMIHPGDKLLIPMPAALAERAGSRAQERGVYVPPQGYERTSYKIKTGDTLIGIARKLGVTVKHLRRVNGLSSSSLIHPGQRLYAYRPGG